ncbi:hypothetical protein E2C01_034606 [Portunus trituberculatus]|uniref:Uncharacterized protein n=1 Tax=Portunus trituberculatus TaxID=210409 RepID=A0A5B7F6R8_PORTR|nr:hypothetical protein [Portunus trituberculatus]
MPFKGLVLNHVVYISGVNQGTSETQYGESYQRKRLLLRLSLPALHSAKQQPTIGQVSKRNKQSKDAWNMSLEAQRIKSVLNLTPQMLQYISLCDPPPPPSPPPHHSPPHLTQNKDKEMKKKRPHYSQLEKLFYKILRKEMKMWKMTTSLSY